MESICSNDLKLYTYSNSTAQNPKIEVPKSQFYCKSLFEAERNHSDFTSTFPQSHENVAELLIFSIFTQCDGMENEMTDDEIKSKKNSSQSEAVLSTNIYIIFI